MSAGGVLITHPGRQHSHQAAVALERAGMLAGYWAGVPSRAEHRGLVPRAIWDRFVRYPLADLPAERAQAHSWVPGLRQLGARFLPRRLAYRLDFAVCRAFDRVMAWRLGEVDAAAVVACEISALATLREAHRLGRMAILDAPAMHHSAQDQAHGFSETPALHRRIVAVKDAEITEADHLITVSELARETYLAAGVPSRKVHAVSLGAELSLFGQRPRARSGRQVRFVFCGAASQRKAFDLLIGAYSEIVRAGRTDSPAVHLRHVGHPAELSRLLDTLPEGSWSAVGSVAQQEWAGELAEVDCLVHPSRNDSYAMVVAEALAAGVPVIVSDMVGAKCLVEEGVNGWVVRVGDVAALAARMRWCAEHPEELRAMEPACRRSAQSATWEIYHTRYAALLRDLLARGRS